MHSHGKQSNENDKTSEAKLKMAENNGERQITLNASSAMAHCELTKQCIICRWNCVTGAVSVQMIVSWNDLEKKMRLRCRTRKIIWKNWPE